MIGCQTYLRSHTVGVSHVAQASAWRSLVASLAYSVVWPRNRKTERSSTSHKIGVADFLSTLEVVPPALMMRGGAMDGGPVIA